MQDFLIRSEDVEFKYVAEYSSCNNSCNLNYTTVITTKVKGRYIVCLLIIYRFPCVGYNYLW